MIDVGVLGALLGGVLTLVSPCSALLLPSFFAYSFDRTGLLLRRTGLFYLGMMTVLAPLGAGVGAIGALLTEYRSQVTTTGGLLMTTLGAAIIAGIGFRIGPAARLAARLDLSSALSVLLLGTVYALAGFCSGPLLGSVLTVAAIGSSPIYGALLMSLYSLGMAAPLFALAFAWGSWDCLGDAGSGDGRSGSEGSEPTPPTSFPAGCSSRSEYFSLLPTGRLRSADSPAAILSTTYRRGCKASPLACRTRP